jgi:hypothetical protein
MAAFSSFLAVAAVGAAAVQQQRAQRGAKEEAREGRRRLETAQRLAEGGPEMASRERGVSRAKQAALSMTGRRDTILTGPLGISGEPEVARRTLLGT